MAFTRALSTNNYGPAKIIVSTSLANGTHTTLTSAMADSVSGDTIFMRNSVTENVTLTPGVNIVAYVGSESTPTVSIAGKLTMTGSGTCTIAGIRLTTNSDYVIVVSGSAASILNLDNCYLNILNSSFIHHTSSSSSSRINVRHSTGNIATTGIATAISTSAGNILFQYSVIENSGLSITPSTTSSGRIGISYSSFSSIFSTIGSGAVDCQHSVLDVARLSINATLLTYAGTGGGFHFNTYFASGSQSSISLGSGTIMSITNSTFDCTATNVITGAGTILYSGLAFIGGSSTINVTNKTRAGTLSGSRNTAPTEGMLGEMVHSFVTQGNAISYTSTVAKNITSISLTPGIWNIAGTGIYYSPSASSGTSFVLSISNTSNTTQLGNGDALVQTPVPPTAAEANTLVVPCRRVLLTSTTTYYLVGKNLFPGTLIGWGSISATRVA